MVWVLYASQTKLCPLRDYTLKQTAHPDRRNTPGNKHGDIYTCASQSMQQKQGLGKTSCWQGITQTRLSPPQSTHRAEACASHSSSLSLRCLWARVNCQEHSILARSNTTPPPPQCYTPPTVRLVASGSLWSQPQWNSMFPTFPPSAFTLHSFPNCSKQGFFTITNPGHCYSPADVQGLCRVQSGANSTPIQWSRRTDSKLTLTSL